VVGALVSEYRQCIDCRKCSMCKDPHDDDKMMFCDSCDRG
jgi:hypothetical protein